MYPLLRTSRIAAELRRYSRVNRQLKTLTPDTVSVPAMTVPSPLTLPAAARPEGPPRPARYKAVTVRSLREPTRYRASTSSTGDSLANSGAVRVRFVKSEAAGASAFCKATFSTKTLLHLGCKRICQKVALSINGAVGLIRATFHLKAVDNSDPRNVDQIFVPSAFSTKPQIRYSGNSTCGMRARMMPVFLRNPGAPKFRS